MSYPLLPRPLLKSVSRSFYLTLAVLPSNVRTGIGVAYLLARAADTIADTDVIAGPRRLHYLTAFRRWLAEPAVHGGVVEDIRSAVLPHHHGAERVLLEQLEVCRQVLEALSPADQGRIQAVLETLTAGMVKDLRAFPGNTAQELAALKTWGDLDHYTYEVAGCVGAFWTQMMCAHRPAFGDWEAETMAAVGVRFGKGLQLTNILRDLAADLRRGRCYIPQELLDQVGLTPGDLLDPAVWPRLKPVVTRLLKVALEHLDQGWLYAMAVPQRELSLRLACVWPVLFGVKTLRRISRTDDLLDPGVTIKMTRREVYQDLALTAGVLGSRPLLTGYYGHLRKSVAC